MRETIDNLRSGLPIFACRPELVVGVSFVVLPNVTAVLIAFNELLLVLDGVDATV